MDTWRLAASIDDIRVPMMAAGEGARLAIATLVEVEGSAPREVGAQMLVSAEQSWGFLSGGCIEADVAGHARAAMDEGRPRSLRYGEGSPWIDIRLACGSAITVLVEPLPPRDPAIAALCGSYLQRLPITLTSDGITRAVTPGSGPHPASWDGTRYTRLFEPPLRLVVVGEDGAALSAAALALEMGWQVVLIAPGGPQDAPIAGIDYHRTSVAAALAQIGIDRWTAIAVLSHDREDDERGLAAALASQAFHVGAIGARARLNARLARLRAHGVDEENIARLNSPIGLHGFGKAPREVALSIIAAVAQAWNARSASTRSPGVSMSMSAPLSPVS